MMLMMMMSSLLYLNYLFWLRVSCVAAAEGECQSANYFVSVGRSLGGFLGSEGVFKLALFIQLGADVDAANKLTIDI